MIGIDDRFYLLGRTQRCWSKMQATQPLIQFPTEIRTFPVGETPGGSSSRFLPRALSNPRWEGRWKPRSLKTLCGAYRNPRGVKSYVGNMWGDVKGPL